MSILTKLNNLIIGGAVAGIPAAGYGTYKLINHFKNNSNK